MSLDSYFDGIDTVLRVAAVDVVARARLGGGFITVVIKRDVAAGKPKGLGKFQPA